MIIALLAAGTSCATQTKGVTIPWQQVSVLDKESSTPESCRFMGVVHSSDGVVGKRDYDYDAAMRRLQKKAGRLGGNRIRVTENTERMRTHSPGSEIELGAEVWGCEAEWARGEIEQIQLIQYPYAHDPERAWRITVLPDGTWLHEESTQPVKVAPMTEVGELEWVAAPRQSTGRIPHKKLAALVNRLRGLELETLQRRYSARHTFLDPTETTLVQPVEGEAYRVPAEMTRLVTHGDTYEIRVSVENVTVESSVYAPLSALSHVDPPHPDREQIALLMNVWYEVLRAIGPIHGTKARHFRRYLRSGEPPKIADGPSCRGPLGVRL